MGRLEQIGRLLFVISVIIGLVVVVWEVTDGASPEPLWYLAFAGIIAGGVIEIYSSD